MIEGHSHTEFCPHGSGDDVEAMIQKAIRLGFRQYCITEHAPLPPDFQQQYAGQPTGFTEAAMALNDLPAYFKKCQLMQRRYANQIKISIGFEVDFLPDQVSWAHDFLDEYGPQTDQNLLSVHFMQGKNQQFWCVDDTLADFKTGFEAWLPTPQRLFKQYLQAMLVAVQADLGQYRPQRIGHLTLIRKFQDYFGLAEPFSPENLILIGQILQLLKEQGRELDLNLAGLYKPYCNQYYPGPQVVEMAKKLGVPLVYGSDAHAISQVGRGWHLAENLI